MTEFVDIKKGWSTIAKRIELTSSYELIKAMIRKRLEARGATDIFIYLVGSKKKSSGTHVTWEVLYTNKRGIGRKREITYTLKEVRTT